MPTLTNKKNPMAAQFTCRGEQLSQARGKTVQQYNHGTDATKASYRDGDSPWTPRCTGGQATCSGVIDKTASCKARLWSRSS